MIQEQKIFKKPVENRQKGIDFNRLKRYTFKHQKQFRRKDFYCDEKHEIF